MRVNVIEVLHINSYFNNSSFYKNLYDKQIQKGLKIKVFVPISKGTLKPDYSTGEYTTISENHKKFDRAFFYLKHHKIYLDLLKIYSVSTFNISHAHSLFSNGYIAMKLKKKFDIPYVVAVRNTDVNIFFKKMPHLRKLGINIMKESNKVIFISKSYQDMVLNTYIPNELKEIIREKSIILPNGIDDFWFENQKENNFNAATKNINILSVGEINKNKNIITTIKALKVLENKNFKVKLTVVGKIKDKEIFSQISKVKFVEYIQPQKKEELLKIYRENDIFVMPSYKETFGLVYAEAMSQGLPIIYSENQGFDKQFEEGKVGFHVKSENEIEIAEKIIEIIDNYKKISRNLSTSVNIFKWDNIVEDYNLLYSDTLA